MNKNLQTFFESRISYMDSEGILDLNDSLNQGDINNVVTGLEKNFFSLLVSEDEMRLEYALLFGTNINELHGYALKLDSELKERDELSFLFARFISENVEGLNILDVFNTFQRSIRTMYEKYQYMTYNPLLFKDISDPNPLMIVKGKRGIIGILEIEKKEFYKEFFLDSKKTKFSDGQEYVYLMYNSRNDLIKIGQSKKPNFREKTLQSEEPEIDLICIWAASKTIEKELHKEFKSKRKRGEWFDLSFIDLEKIKKRMEEFTKPN